AFDAQLELDLRQRVQVAIELLQLVLGVPADRIADLDVLALHLKSHRVSSWTRSDPSGCESSARTSRPRPPGRPLVGAPRRPRWLSLPWCRCRRRAGRASAPTG